MNHRKLRYLLEVIISFPGYIPREKLYFWVLRNLLNVFQNR